MKIYSLSHKDIKRRHVWQLKKIILVMSLCLKLIKFKLVLCYHKVKHIDLRYKVDKLK